MCVSQDPWAAVDATYLSSPSPPNADDRSSVIVTVPAPLENNVKKDTELPAAPASPAASVKTTLTEAVEQEMDKLGVQVRPLRMSIKRSFQVQNMEN